MKTRLEGHRRGKESDEAGDGRGERPASRPHTAGEALISGLQSHERAGEELQAEPPTPRRHDDGRHLEHNTNARHHNAVLKGSQFIQPAAAAVKRGAHVSGWDR